MYSLLIFLDIYTLFVFSYYLATAAEDNTVRFWDLRKTKTFQTITLEDDYQLSSIEWDWSGTYLAVAGADIRYLLSLFLSSRYIAFLRLLPLLLRCSYCCCSLSTPSRVYLGKTANHISTFSKHTATVTDVKWGKDAQSLVSVSMDRSMKIWGRKE